VARAGRLFAASLGALLFLFIGGFVIFASAVVARPTPWLGEQADGIVVLTGGQHRLSEAARLLAEGRGRRLLVSGANRVVTREEIHRRSGLDARMFEKVDIGYVALDTIGNAGETRDWARSKGFSRLIIVTSNYHMPRSLTELGRAMPEVTLVPYRVSSANFRSERWWMHIGTARLIFSEYVKFIPSAARLAVARLVRSWDGVALADYAQLRASAW
jgi:uncharacterized SAM-binding protein YcdF (DUF218 family)